MKRGNLWGLSPDVTFFWDTSMPPESQKYFSVAFIIEKKLGRERHLRVHETIQRIHPANDSKASCAKNYGRIGLI